MVVTPDPPAEASSSAVDEELSQAKARLGVCIFALLYISGWSLLSAPVSRHIVAALLGYTLLSTLWFLWVRAVPGEFHSRRIPIIFGDLGINTFFMHVLQAKGAFFYPMFLWIIIGNGVRFGSRYLLLAMSMGVAFFLPMLMLSPYWQANIVAGSGLLVGLIVLPLFNLSLIQRLQATRRRLLEEVERSHVAARAKTEFLANMSHELRTPMSGVIGVVQLMRLTSLDDRQKTHLDLIQRSADALLTIIDDVLEFSRIEAGKVTLEPVPFDLHSVVEDVYDLLRPGANGKGLDLKLDFDQQGGRTYLGDPTRIRQILLNLVGNAVKFTEHGSIRIEVNEDYRSFEMTPVSISVVDTGIGISPEKIEHIFEKFEQAESRLRRRVGGSGLGLAISRQLAEMMGGDIRVRSEPGKGSVFTVHLTLEASDQTVPSLPRETPGTLLKSRRLDVLVVEDNPVNQLVICSFLDRLGFSSQVAEDGQRALDLVAGRRFDLVLLDIQLPVLDGLEVCRRIRASEGPGQHLPIIALTANASAEDRRTCLSVGMDSHLRKPLLQEDLVAALNGLSERGLLGDFDKL